MTSNLTQTLLRVASRSASAVVGRTRIAVPAVNAVLSQRLAGFGAGEDALVADPVFEAAKTWRPATQTFDQLSGTLLEPRLVDTLDRAERERMPRDRHPYAHQVDAWDAARKGESYIVTSGTGSGKTECFMVPMLDDLLRDARGGRLVGVRAIVLYPLNALIESQRERLVAWTDGLADRLSFALYNGQTPERTDPARSLGKAELGDRRSIRESPPAILVTNITMLEYCLLRDQDRSLLEASQGLLRWIILDEAHGYVGAQAAELALLLRRVRAAFGVSPDQVRLVATSATISDGASTQEKLSQFVADLAGHGQDRVRVIVGKSVEPTLPATGPDIPLVLENLEDCDDEAAWLRLASHPRIQALKLDLSSSPLALSGIATRLFGDPSRQVDAQRLLDAAARAQPSAAAQRLLPWRAHVFHRALAGVWVCVDPDCPHRERELAEAPDWSYGAIWLHTREQCVCGALVLELSVCGECGAPHLFAHRSSGARVRLTATRATDVDDFAVDEEPETADEEEAEAVFSDEVYIRAAVDGEPSVETLDIASGVIYDGEPPAEARTIAILIFHDARDRGCCAGARHLPRLLEMRLGPAFFIGATASDLLEGLATPLVTPGLPVSGRRALTFSDSRQGVARLAAKLQQEAERTLTRAFLYHSVQEGQAISAEERRITQMLLDTLRRADPDKLAAEQHRNLEKRLSDDSGIVLWPRLVDRLSQHDELVSFATEVWKDRGWGAHRLGDDTGLLARMFLFRELARRPRVQNNAETLGLVRLVFPELRDAALYAVPPSLRQMGIDGNSYEGLAQAAVDLVFRDTLSVDLTDSILVRWVSPRRAVQQAIAAPSLTTAEMPENTRRWPEARPIMARVPRMVSLIARLLRVDIASAVGRDRVNEVLAHLWELIRRHAAKDIGRNCWRLNFDKAAVERVTAGWRCPITRRVFGYTPAGLSPYAGDTGGVLTALQMPRLPQAHALGLAEADRNAMATWCAADGAVAELRRRGLWTDFHDRLATYPRFLRAQEHSAQIEREVLHIYEERFREGRINFLNCSTTMEMGIDLPDVGLVVNANLPPSISNYRQRVGRAGRRGEPWAFGMTFCRDQPLDQAAFRAPIRFLEAPIISPCVRLDSAVTVMRHVNAFLLAAFVAGQAHGLRITQSVGDFLGAGETPEEAVRPGNAGDAFIECMRDTAFAERHQSDLRLLIQGTVLAPEDSATLFAKSAETMDELVRRWRDEHLQLLLGTQSHEADVAEAYRKRARRMRGEFLLSELARRGFTPAYGFPVDVVHFDHAAERDRRIPDRPAFNGRGGGGYFATGASRTLDIALREYAPGCEVVIDGFVHRSEGVQPAWASNADASRLEDLQSFWLCHVCGAFGLTRSSLVECASCGVELRGFVNTLRPAGFLGRREPHTGYEVIDQAPFEMPHVSAAGVALRTLPDPETGQVRANPLGQIVTLSAGSGTFGYAVCLACGRAALENEPLGRQLPSGMRQHEPLAPLRGAALQGRYCPGGTTQPQRIQRNIRFVHSTTTDVFEWRLPRQVTKAQALGLGAGLREALAERLGAEAREIGVAVGNGGDGRAALFLHDRAAGGAGMVSRLGEHEMFAVCLRHASEKLDCPEQCTQGCSACVLRADLCYRDERLDRPGALALAHAFTERLDLPQDLRVFGDSTHYLGQSVGAALTALARRQPLEDVTFYIHGSPDEWDFETSGLVAILDEDAPSQYVLALPASARLDARFGLSQALTLFRMARHAVVAEVPVLPSAAGMQVLVSFRQSGRDVAIAGPAGAAIPGPEWGEGSTAPLVLGQFLRPSMPAPLDLLALVNALAGGAQLHRITGELDGSIDSFGQRFWGLVRSLAPALVDAMDAHGVAQVTYSDRYVVSPLTIRIVWEALHATPGRRTTTSLRVLTKVIDRQNGRNAPWRFDQFFQSTDDRNAILEQLVGRGSVVAASRSDRAHERVLILELADGRIATINLDQGFGAWRIRNGMTLRHAFDATVVAQTNAIRAARLHVELPAGASTPIVIGAGRP